MSMSAAMGGSPKEQGWRQRWFKLLACEVHTWPISSCDACEKRVQALLERVCENEYKAEGVPA